MQICFLASKAWQAVYSKITVNLVDEKEKFTVQREAATQFPQG